MGIIKNIVIESFLDGNYAPLYHSTYIDSIIDILNDNSLLGTTKIYMEKIPNGLEKYRDNYGYFRGVSTTRDKTFLYKNYPFTFILDSNKLKQTHKLIPYNYLLKIESEEFVLGSIKNLHKYLIGLRINDKSKISKDILKSIKDYIKKYPHIKLTYLK